MALDTRYPLSQLFQTTLAFYQQASVISKADAKIRGISKLPKFFFIRILAQILHACFSIIKTEKYFSTKYVTGRNRDDD